MHRRSLLLGAAAAIAAPLARPALAGTSQQVALKGPSVVFWNVSKS